jgi:squalene-associated FAD-dependent desaturase
MTSGAEHGAPVVAIVGGGLAGLAAAVSLAGAGCRVELFEARSRLGGRAASFRDPATGEWIDHCQHVSMGCCTNLADFCRRIGIANFFRRDRTLHFIGPDGRDYPFTAAGWLPAPLHLVPGFWSLKFLSLGDRLAIARALWSLMRTRAGDALDALSVGQWLRQQSQPAAAIERFWKLIFVSALGEELDRASLSAARKVIIDGFLSARDAYIVEVPETPLGSLYGEHLEQWFAAHAVRVRAGAPVRQVACDGRLVIALADGERLRADYVVLAVPWSKVAALVPEAIAACWPWLAEISAVEAVPITGVHLWFDRPITDLPHAALVGRLSQWIFNRGPRAEADSPAGYYYQVVISASRSLDGRDRQQIVAEVCADLAAIWPAAAAANLVQARVVTESSAVFSPWAGLDRMRPAQQTPTPGVLVAGDWTATGWPATMESAVRSGYLAAEAIASAIGRPERFLIPDLPRGLWSRLLIRSP